jgi:hypothetical protein
MARGEEGFKGGNQGGVLKVLTWHIYAEAGQHGEVRSGEERRGHERAQAAQMEKKGLTCAAHMSVTGEEKRCHSGTHKPRSQEKIQMELVFEFQMNLEFCKTLRNFIRRFRRNLDFSFFPKFF